jgi:hypothetical protein
MRPASVTRKRAKPGESARNEQGALDSRYLRVRANDLPSHPLATDLTKAAHTSVESNACENIDHVPGPVKKTRPEK